MVDDEIVTQHLGFLPVMVIKHMIESLEPVIILFNYFVGERNEFNALDVFIQLKVPLIELELLVLLQDLSQFL